MTKKGLSTLSGSIDYKGVSPPYNPDYRGKTPITPKKINTQK